MGNIFTSQPINPTPTNCWSNLDRDIQVLVIEQLPISQRVLISRVDTNCGKISEELLKKQKRIHRENFGSDAANRKIYRKLISRCPNLIELDMKLLSVNAPGVIQNLYYMYPNIKRFKNISHDFDGVKKFLESYRESIGYVNNSIEYLDLKGLSRYQIETLTKIVNYKVTG